MAGSRILPVFHPRHSQDFCGEAFSGMTLHLDLLTLHQPALAGPQGPGGSEAPCLFLLPWYTPYPSPGSSQCLSEDSCSAAQFVIRSPGSQRRTSPVLNTFLAPRTHAPPTALQDRLLLIGISLVSGCAVLPWPLQSWEHHYTRLPVFKLKL